MTGRKFMSADAWIRSRVSLEGVPGKADHNVAARLGADFSFSNTRAVNALPDDGNCLVELLLIDLTGTLYPGCQDHLGSAFKVQSKLGSPTGVASHHSASQDSG
jgi:hypothetical protein